MKIAMLAAALALVVTGCTDTNRAHIFSLGNSAQVTLYSATGQVIHTWKSTGKVQNGQYSDGYEFVDSATGNLIRVSGSVVVEQKI